MAVCEFCLLGTRRGGTREEEGAAALFTNRSGEEEERVAGQTGVREEEDPGPIGILTWPIGWLADYLVP